MSHSTVLVIGPSNKDELTTALAPFDENTEVDPYIDRTREQQIADAREGHARAAENLRKYKAGEPPYDRPFNNPEHVHWIETEAPELAALDDGELWEYIVKKETWEERDEDGAIWSTYNPKSKWDWYQVGGRWDGDLIVHQKGTNHVTRLGDLDLDETHPTFAVLTPDGEWHERGRMGWWGHVSDGQEPDEWAAKWRALVKQHQDSPAYLVDVHI